MADLCAEVTLGAALEGIVKTISHARDRISKFGYILAELKATLENVSSKIDRLTASNDEFHRSKLVLERAEELVNNCSEVAWWNYCKKYRYSKMLQEMDESLRKIIVMDLKVAQLVILKEIKEMVTKLDRHLLETNGDERVLKRSRTQIFRMISGLKRIVGSTPYWIIQYLSSFSSYIRVRKWGYQRTTKHFPQ